jgi:hypothetical protein
MAAPASLSAQVWHRPEVGQGGLAPSEPLVRTRLHLFPWLVLAACAGKGDTGSAPAVELDCPNDGPLLLDTALVREVSLVLLALPHGRVADANRFLENFVAGEGGACPPVRPTGPDEWTVGGWPCTTELGHVISGQVVFDGWAFDDRGEPVDGPFHQEWMEVRQVTGASDTDEGSRYYGDVAIDGFVDANMVGGSIGGAASGSLRMAGVGGVSIDFLAGEGIDARTGRVPSFWTDWLMGTVDDTRPDGEPVQVQGRVCVDELGYADIEGEVLWDPHQCLGEPIAGELHVSGANEVTVVMDGATVCDLVSPIEGDFEDVLAWGYIGR